MKNILDAFKGFLLEADLPQYILNGKITLYHYSNLESETLILDPVRFGQSSYSQKEKETSSVPRVFFYINLAHRERFISSSRGLYKVDVNAKNIYNLKEDPSGYIEKIRHPTYGLRKQIEWDNLLNEIKEDYSGVFYSTSSMDIVAWFKEIIVSKVPKKERELLER